MSLVSIKVINDKIKQDTYTCTSVNFLGYDAWMRRRLFHHQ